MFRIVLIFLGVILASVGYAQDCQPDETVPDSVVVAPLPYNEMDRPEGGMTDTACVGSPYEFVFTFNIPAIYNVGGFEVPLIDVSIPVEDGINSLPGSMDYVCNPPNCVFAAQTKGCIIVSGTPTADEIGLHDLTINATINAGLELDVLVPGQLEDGSHYYLTVREEGGSNCFTNTDNETFAADFGLSNRPNPFGNYTQIVIDAETNGNYQFFVTDLLGRQVHLQEVELTVGENTIDFDGSQLAKGMYLYGITDGRYAATSKMIINR
ncbi:MAG: T9SS type A sorting domain-containing protein [Mameliella sp.]|nr:T9SS type A sorting domain-containing protein [Phaeodactylibacter sp.]NRA49194.1 T9SS type A sorting domain-containing protein [Phaeodactylibacter sp.]